MLTKTVDFLPHLHVNLTWHFLNFQSTSNLFTFKMIEDHKELWFTYTILIDSYIKFKNTKY